MLKISIGPGPARGLEICNEKRGAMVIGSAILTWVFKLEPEFEPKLEPKPVPSPDWREREKKKIFYWIAKIVATCVSIETRPDSLIVSLALKESVRCVCFFSVSSLCLNECVWVLFRHPVCLCVRVILSRQFGARKAEDMILIYPILFMEKKD